MKKNIIILMLIVLAPNLLKAQFIEDALRFTQTNGYITPRAGGLNVAFYGIADDYSALYFNPAGLSLVARSEVSFGLGFQRNSTNADLLKSSTNFKSNDAYVNHAGIVAPFPTKYGNAAIAIGYALESNFSNNMEYSAFNEYSSMIGYDASVGNIRDPGRANLSQFLSTRLWLADDEYKTPINGKVLQKAFIKESGGIHSFSGGMGIDVSKNVSIGFSLVGKWGTYNYDREYSEFDRDNVYNTTDSLGDFVMEGTHYKNIDFNKMTLNESLTQEISGIGGSIGVMARLADFMRFSGTIKFPTFFDITETFKQSANATFDDGGTINNPFDYRGETSYKVQTPFIYAAGISVNTQGLTFTAGVEYSDVTQMEFSDAPDEVLRLNNQIIRELVGQTTWGFGAEYEIPLLPFVVRASFSSTTSPYIKDVAGSSLNVFSFGGGVYVAPNVRLDALFRWTDLTQYRINYGDGSVDLSTINLGQGYNFTTQPMNIGFQVTYRY